MKVRDAVLTPAKRSLLEEYLVDLNGKQAAIRCGYCPVEPERTACELLASRKVFSGTKAKG